MSIRCQPSTQTLIVINVIPPLLSVGALADVRPVSYKLRVNRVHPDVVPDAQISTPPPPLVDEPVCVRRKRRVLMAWCLHVLEAQTNARLLALWRSVEASERSRTRRGLLISELSQSRCV